MFEAALIIKKKKDPSGADSRGANRARELGKGIGRVSLAPARYEEFGSVDDQFRSGTVGFGKAASDIETCA